MIWIEKLLKGIFKNLFFYIGESLFFFLIIVVFKCWDYIFFFRYEMIVIVIDKGNLYLSGIFIVDVFVIDVNDNLLFVIGIYDIIILEDFVIGIMIFLIKV